MRTFAIVIFLLAGAGTINAQEQKQQSCVTGKCHTTYGKEKYVHGPVAVGECTPCHHLLPNEKHKFQDVVKSEELCVKCHEPMEKKGLVHVPVAKGQCITCHDPHQSNQRFQIRKEPIAEVCFSCHNRAIMKKKYAHGPASEGDCTTCHTPHMSDKPKLLLRTGNDLCFECHVDMKEAFAGAKHIHKPASGNCIQCHNPHSNDSPFMLAKDVPEQCFTCHKDIQDVTSKALIKHQALDTEKKCLNCHSPHDAPYAMQLKDEPMSLCFTCHNKSVESPYGGILTNMKDLFEKNKNWHGPIRERDCSGCHNVHGSGNFRLLKQNYSKEFYTSFAQEQYELCFGCHQPSLVQDGKTSTLTGFRDGDKNLHYLHVNKKIKGRTCRACHETHASQLQKHIREGVPFGQWILPIRFEQTSSGGKCAPGCHSPKEYTRLSSPSANKR